MKIIFSEHALKRLKEYDVLPSKARVWLASARRCKRNFWREAMKLGKYGIGQADVSYYWAAGYLFTIDEKDYILRKKRFVITVTKKRQKGLKFV